MCRAVLGTSSSSRVDGAAPPARLQKLGVQKYSTKNVVTNRDGVQYCTPLQKLLLAMERRLHIGREVVAAEEADAEEVEAAVANFEQLPVAVQKMFVMAHDEDKFREHAGPVIAAYKKALVVGALESTAERAAAAAAYAIKDSGYREYIEHDKQWQLQRGTSTCARTTRSPR